MDSVKRSYDTQLIFTIHDFATRLNNREKSMPLTRPVKDLTIKVPHIRLHHELLSYGIRGNTLKWIQFLSGRTNGKQSDSCTILSGVPQGSV